MIPCGQLNNDPPKDAHDLLPGAGVLPHMAEKDPTATVTVRGHASWVTQVGPVCNHREGGSPVTRETETPELQLSPGAPQELRVYICTWQGESLCFQMM